MRLPSLMAFSSISCQHFAPRRASPSSILISQQNSMELRTLSCSVSSIALASGKRIGGGCAARVNISLSLSRRHSRQSMRLLCRARNKNTWLSLFQATGNVCSCGAGRRFHGVALGVTLRWSSAFNRGGTAAFPENLAPPLRQDCRGMDDPDDCFIVDGLWHGCGVLSRHSRNPRRVSKLYRAAFCALHCGRRHSDHGQSGRHPISEYGRALTRDADGEYSWHNRGRHAICPPADPGEYRPSP